LSVSSSAEPAATKPTIVAVAEDEETFARLSRALTSRYGGDYTIVVDRSVEDGLRRLEHLARAATDVALILADRASGGTSLLAAAHAIHPYATRALVLEWAENRRAREELVEALARGQADYFVVKPMASPDERFHRAVTELLDEWWRLRGAPFEAVRVVGDDGSARSHEICDLLQRHDFPYGFYASDSPAGRALLEEVALVGDGRPVVVVAGIALLDPTNAEVAEALGARTKAEPGVYDVVVVGGGPAGLSVAVYAASEGLRTALVERVALGGQAGMSSRIRNYLGFPRGVSGAELAARAVDQAILFGTDMIYGSTAISLRADGEHRVVGLSDGSEVTAKAVVIATGVSYRRLAVPALEPFNGVGVFYGAAMSEARALRGEPVYVVGGGNSAGQAAMYLAKFASHVTLLVRSDSLAESMSDYLIKDIEATANIEVRYRVAVVDAGGQGRFEWLTLEDLGSGEIETTPAAALFVLIGAEPFTDWLPPSILRDDWGYLLTGRQCTDPSCWRGGCEVDAGALAAHDDAHGPLIFETSLEGVFAAGDVRRGSVKRVASAAGEGAMCVRLVHEYLSPTRP
jgi:thioredoxin reductase (NADPH)